MGLDGKVVVANALTWFGTPWAKGGKRRGPDGGVDCSNLVNSVYAESGAVYPYVSTGAFPPPGYFQKVDTPLEGDVVLFAGHMGVVANGPHGENLISAEGSEHKAGKVQYGKREWFGEVVGYYRWAR